MMFYAKFSPQKRRLFDRQRWQRSIRLLGLLLILLGLLGIAWLPQPAAAATSTMAIPVVQIDGPIDLGVAPYLARVLREAEQEGARAVILEINTPGGRLDAVLQMREALLESPVRTIAFVNREAFSAGALIALASNDIYMAPGAVIGAATPVIGNGVQADEKTVSAVRGTFKATAETRGRDSLIAQAMVDPSVTVPGFPAGRLVTLTTDDAMARGFINGVATDRAAVLRAAGLAGTTAQVAGISPAERLVRILTVPAVGALLFGLGALLVVWSIVAGELSAFTILGLGALALFFWGHTLAGLAGWEGIALAALGILLVAAEMLVFPGFGIAGILGGASLLGALVISVTSGDLPTGAEAERSLPAILLALMTFVVGGGLLFWLLPATARRRGMVLQTALMMDIDGAGNGTPGTPPSAVRQGGIWRAMQLLTGAAARGEQSLDHDLRPSLLRARGQALSDLRPGGFALIGGERIDVITRGEVIPGGAVVEVIRDEGYRRVVREVAPDEPEEEIL